MDHGFVPSHGTCKVSISHMMTPREKMSLAEDAEMLSNSSGANHLGFIAAMELDCMVASMYLERLKSVSLMLLCSLMSTLGLFRSRCKMFLACRYSKPSAIS